MNNIITPSQHKYYTFSGFGTLEKNQTHHLNSAYIKQQMHENKIDEFFWTNTDAPKKKFSYLAMLGSIAGVVTPLIILGKKQNPTLKLNSLKNIFKVMNIKYELKQILSVGIGGALGGLIGGLADRNEGEKLDKIEEATFQLMNITFPAVLINSSLKFCEKNKHLNKSFIKLSASALAMVIGAGTAVELSNKIDDKFFDKYNKDPERKFKKKDIIVHFDDLIGALVLAKIPFAEKLHAEKILPLVFAWSGYHVGEN